MSAGFYINSQTVSIHGPSGNASFPGFWYNGVTMYKGKQFRVLVNKSISPGYMMYGTAGGSFPNIAGYGEINIAGVIPLETQVVLDSSGQLIPMVFTADGGSSPLSMGLIVSTPPPVAKMEPGRIITMESTPQCIGLPCTDTQIQGQICCSTHVSGRASDERQLKTDWLSVLGSIRSKDVVIYKDDISEEHHHKKHKKHSHRKKHH
jgi:hypothetical protein